jgi:hypothetical protein
MVQTQKTAKPGKTTPKKANEETDFLITQWANGPFLWFGLLFLPVVASLLVLIFGWLTGAGQQVPERRESPAVMRQIEALPMPSILPRRQENRRGQAVR